MLNCYRKLPPYLLSVLVLSVILWLTLSPDPVGETGITLFPGADKVAHAVMFLALAVALTGDLNSHAPRLPLLRAAVAAAALSAASGIGVEWLQYAMGLGRTAEVADMVADTSGAAVVPLAVLLKERFCVK